MIWIILGIVSILLLAFYYNKKNAVWGGLAIGIILGLITAVIMYFQGFGFDWSIIGKFIVVCVLTGFGAELLGRIGDSLKRK